MKAAVYHGEGKALTVENLDDPTPGPEDVILKVHRCGICGTDLHMTSGHHFDFPVGTVPGHEYAGEVVAVGKKVKGFKTGDLIAGLPSTGCGRADCEACKHGNNTLCKAAPGVMGGFAEFVRVPQSVAVALPESLSLVDGALIEPLAVGLYGCRQADIRPGDKVLVLGAGSVALCAIYWARRLGAGKIVAMSRSPARRDMTQAMGADGFVCYGDNEGNEAIEALGGSPDVVLECVGVPGMLSKSISHAKLFGRVVSMGFCTAPDSVMPAMAAMKAVSLVFPVGYTMKDFQHVANVMDKGHVDPKLLVSSVVSLDELPATIERLRAANTETKVHVSAL